MIKKQGKMSKTGSLSLTFSLAALFLSILEIWDLIGIMQSKRILFTFAVFLVWPAILFSIFGIIFGAITLYKNKDIKKELFLSLISILISAFVLIICISWVLFFLIV